MNYFSLDGTTDVTRTFHYGRPTDFEIDAYTRKEAIARRFNIHQIYRVTHHLDSYRAPK